MTDLLKTTNGRLGAGGAILVLVLAAGWFLGVSPQKKKTADLRAETEAAATTLAEKRAALEHPAASVTIKAADSYILKTALPDAVDVPRALLDIQGLAKRYGLTLSAVRPQQAVVGAGYSALPMDITVQGGFAKLSRFLRDMRATVRVDGGRLRVTGPAYSIEKIDIGQPSAPDVFPIVRAQVTLNAYSFVPTAPVAPDTSTATPVSPTTSHVAQGATP
jgi:hypothetical protein